MLDRRFLNGIRLGFNVGVVVRERSTYFNVEEGSELAYAAAIGYRLGGIEGRTEIGLEVNGGVGLTASDNEEWPLELLGYLRHAFDPAWEVIGGPAVGPRVR